MSEIKQSSKIILAFLDILVVPIILVLLNNYLSNKFGTDTNDTEDVKIQNVTLIASPNSNTFVDNENNQNSFNTTINTTINQSIADYSKYSYSIIGVNNKSLVDEIEYRGKIIVEKYL